MRHDARGKNNNWEWIWFGGADQQGVATNFRHLGVTMTTIRVSNWDKWQTYRKDRGTPPWIKVHRSILTSTAWATLSDAEKGQLISIWVVAADKCGVISGDAKILKKVCQLDKEPNISKFKELGLLEIIGGQCDDILASSGCQHDAPEAEGETYKEEKINGQNEFDRFWEVYPRKKQKKDACRIFLKGKFSADELIADIQNRMENDDQWTNGYIPNPTTYLNQERWTDEITPKRTKKAQGLPYDNEGLAAWCKERGLPAEGRPGETTREWRSRLEALA